MKALQVPLRVFVIGTARVFEAVTVVFSGKKNRQGPVAEP